MAHKVQILDIDHVIHAGRLIIKYQLCCNTVDQNSPGWFYISAGTAYRGLCDEDWICMTPNAQHPLHSQEIRNAGIYFYVWDYHGVQGLSALNFTSDTSFLIQIALQDTGCGWSDPCDANPCLTPSTADDPGVPVEGDIGTQGNCGAGYLIGLDANGCPCCEIDDWCLIPGNGNNVPAGPHAGDPVQGAVGTQGNCPDGAIIQLDDTGCPECVEDDPTPPCGGGAGPGIICVPGGSAGPAGAGPYDGPPDDPPPPGGGGSTTIDGGGEASNIGDGLNNLEGGAGGRNPDGFYAWFGPAHNQYVTHAGDLGAPSDTPDQQTTIGPGPHISYHGGGPFGIAAPESQFGKGYPGTHVSGHLPDWFNFQNPNDPGGDGTYTTSNEKVTRSPGIFRRGGWGGKSPNLHTINLFSPNQLYSISTHDVVHPRNIAPSDQEVQITTRHFIPQSGPTINTIAGGNPVRGKTSVTDAVFIKDGVAYMKFYQNFRREIGVARRDGILTAMSRVALGITPSTNKHIDIRAAKRNITSLHGAIDNETTVGAGRTTSFGSSAGISQRSPSRSLTTRTVLDTVKNMGLFKNDASFLNQNYADLNIAPDNYAIVGGDIHCSAFANPKEFGKQTFSMAIFIKDSKGKVIQIGSTQCRTSSNDRRLAVLANTSELSAGIASVILMMFDKDNVPFFRIVRSLTLTEASGIDGASNLSFGGRGRNPIDSAVRGQTFKDPARFRLNTEFPTILLLLQRDNLRNPTKVNIAAQILNVNDQTRTHTISVFDSNGFSFLKIAQGEAAFDFARFQNFAYQGNLLARSSSNLLEDGTVLGFQPNASAVLFKTVDNDAVGNDGVICIVSLTDGKRATNIIDFVLGDDLRLVTNAFSPVGVADDGTLSFVYNGPFPLTQLEFFVAGGNNHVPLDPDIIRVTTTKRGIVVLTNVVADKGNWMGVALSRAPGSLSARTIFYKQL